MSLIQVADLYGPMIRQSALTQFYSQILSESDKLKRTYPTLFETWLEPIDQDPRFQDLRSKVLNLLALMEDIDSRSKLWTELLEFLRNSKTPMRVAVVESLKDVDLSKTQPARKAFQHKYINMEMCAESFMEHATRQLGLWVTDNPKNPKYHGMYFPVVNGSMTGKSRLFEIIALHMCFGIYICTALTKNVFPEADPKARSLLLVDGSPELRGFKEGEMNIFALVIACGEKLVSWLQDRVKNEPDVDDPVLFAEWFMKQQDCKFWDEIRGLRDDVKMQLDYCARLNSLKPELQYVGRAYLEKFKKDSIRLPLKDLQISESDWDSFDRKNWYTNLGRLFRERVSKSCQTVNRVMLERNKEFSKRKADLLAEWNQGKKQQSHCWPAWILFIDESRSLIVNQSKNADQQDCVFDGVRTVSTKIPRGPDSMMFCLAGATPKISIFSPAGDLPSSSRDGDEKCGVTLCEPFWDLRTTDVHEIKEKNIFDVLLLRSYSAYGRPGLYLFQRFSNPRSLISLLQRKLAGDESGEPRTDAAFIGIMASLLCLNVFAYSPLVEELVGSHMQKLIGITEDRHGLFLRPCPEPSLAYAARILANEVGWGECFRRVEKRQGTDIDVGCHGEVGCQALLLMAAEKAEKASCFNAEALDFPICPVSIWDLLKELRVSAPNLVNDREALELLSKWKSDLINTYVRLVQFTRGFSEITPDFLLSRFCRANGIMCPRNQAGVDGFLPSYISDTPLESVSDLVKAELQDSKMSFVGLQFRNSLRSPGPAAYRSLSTVEMRADRVLGCAAFERDWAVPYVSLLLDCGPNSRRKPRVWVFESDHGKQLSIVIRGLRPSHILGEEHLADDKAFVRFIAGPVRPTLGPLSVLKFREGDMYKQPACTILDRNRQWLKEVVRKMTLEANCYLGKADTSAQDLLADGFKTLKKYVPKKHNSRDAPSSYLASISVFETIQDQLILIAAKKAERLEIQLLELKKVQGVLKSPDPAILELINEKHKDMEVAQRELVAANQMYDKISANVVFDEFDDVVESEEDTDNGDPQVGPGEINKDELGEEKERGKGRKRDINSSPQAAFKKAKEFHN